MLISCDSCSGAGCVSDRRQAGMGGGRYLNAPQHAVAWQSGWTVRARRGVPNLPKPSEVTGLRCEGRDWKRTSAATPPVPPCDDLPPQASHSRVLPPATGAPEMSHVCRSPWRDQLVNTLSVCQDQMQLASGRGSKPQDRLMNHLALLLATMGLSLSYYSVRQMGEEDKLDPEP
ncbi:hypothetical protein lerEdw1_009506 [Lerista edwardsae]|nr:hypothetical protein lerEdw1_009506 [Lerista edwardsae]